MMEAITIGTSYGYTYPVSIKSTPYNDITCNALVDTGAIKSCLSSSFINQLEIKTILPLGKMTVCTASGSSLQPIGLADVDFILGTKTYKQRFIVCEGLLRPMILGLDFLQTNRIGIDWDSNGGKVLVQNDEVLVEAIDGLDPDPMVRLAQVVRLPARSVAVVTGLVRLDRLEDNTYYDFEMSPLLRQEYPNVIIPSMVHHTGFRKASKWIKVPVLIVNLASTPIQWDHQLVVGTLIAQPIDINHVRVQSALDEDAYQTYLKTRDLDINKMITSPAEVEVHRRVELPDAEVPEKYKDDLKQLCKDYSDIFSTSSADIGHTTLVTMDIDTGDSPPICQKPYNLPLKHAEWVRGELELLEKAGIISRSMSPWASPIVIVPKKSAPDEPPRRRMCIDYRALNSLLPPVKKAYSNAKGVLTLVPLPKIDEIYAKLQGSSIYTSLDLRSGYHNISLSEESQPKSAFVTPMGKYEFSKVPFGLAQAPAYFQQLINRVLFDLPYTFGYLDDILIFSPDAEMHIDHISKVFQRMREVNLKLKESKCNFMKNKIQYLGHFISGEGIAPIPEKLEAMEKIPSPRNPKEVKQFLGLVGYYRKFIPRFADIARNLTNLTRKNVPFIWTDQCEKSFKLLQEELLKHPILRYPDPDKQYILFTDASKYAWAGVLTQPYENKEQNKMQVVNHPISYQSGLFRGPQINWAALTKEAYAIYICCKKLVFFIQDDVVQVYSDHKPLQKFVHKQTLNSKVNNWAVELEGIARIKIDHIEGIKNTLADTLSRLVDIDPNMIQEPEPDGYEFGYCLFEELPPIVSCLEYLGDTEFLEEKFPNKVIYVETQTTNLDLQDNLDKAIPTDDTFLTLPLENVHMKALQLKDPKCKKILHLMKHKPDSVHQHYTLKYGLLHRYIYDNFQTFVVLVIPESLQPHILQMAHDELGHNGSTRTHMAIKRLYYWKGMKNYINRYIKGCKVCQKRNQQVVKYASLHFDVPTMPMQFISMDLIGEFHPPSAKGNRFALTVICMLTGYTYCIPLRTKTAMEVVQAYMDHVYCQFGGSQKILSDNGTEFKNALFEEVAQEIGVQYKVYTPPYHPQSNGRIEGFHSFLKACLSKHITPKLEWDEVVPLACAAYNFLPNEHSKESPFFLMFGRDPLLPLNKLLQPKVRYMGNDKGILSLEALKKVYEIAARNIERARKKKQEEGYVPPPMPIKVNDMVMIKNHTAGPFDPKYQGDYRVIAIKGNQIEVQAVNSTKSQRVHVSDCKYLLPADSVIHKLPDVSQFGRRTNLRLPPKYLPDLHWELNDEQTDINELTGNPINCYSFFNNLSGISGSVQRDLIIDTTKMSMTTQLTSITTVRMITQVC